MTKAQDKTSPLSAHLSGACDSLDPRTHVFRRDLADIALRDRVAAPYYADFILMQGGRSHAPMRARPDAAAPLSSMLLRGEAFEMFDTSGGWAWGRCRHDGYVGYVRYDDLVPHHAPTHRVTAPVAPIFSAPDVKAPTQGHAPMNALLSIASVDAGADFYALNAGADAGGFVCAHHICAIGHEAGDPATIARHFCGSPYVWGGRTLLGIDCSGLVQAAFAVCGRPCPRDSDQQAASLGDRLDSGAPLQAGDVVFFMPGHVGMMVDAHHLIHASAHQMRVLVEPLDEVVARIKKAQGAALSVFCRRPDRA